MNKSEIIEAIASAVDISKSVAGKALDVLVQTITEALAKGDPVAILGLGTFTVRERAARVGRNPQTGAAINIKESIAPVFKPGKALKEAVQKDAAKDK